MPGQHTDSIPTDYWLLQRTHPAEMDRKLNALHQSKNKLIKHHIYIIKFLPMQVYLRVHQSSPQGHNKRGPSLKAAIISMQTNPTPIKDCCRRDCPDSNIKNTSYSIEPELSITNLKSNNYYCTKHKNQYATAKQKLKYYPSRRYF